MTTTGFVLGAVGTLLLTIVGGVLVPNVFGRHAEKAAVITLWAITGALAVTCVWAGASMGYDGGAFGVVLTVAVLMGVVAVMLTATYVSTHDRKPKAHDPRRTQPDSDPG